MVCHTGIVAASAARRGAYGNCILWLDAADPACVFRDAAGTTPAVANDVVNRWKDKSSAHNDATYDKSAGTLRTDSVTGRTLLRGCIGMSLANPYLLSPCAGMTLFAVMQVDGGITQDGGSLSMSPLCQYTNELPLINYNNAWYETAPGPAGGP